MAIVTQSRKPLSVDPLKVAQPVGATLAFLGLARCLPLMHGSQGCTAFGKVFFVRHFREPIPVQTTAMDQVSTIMGADGNLIEALVTLCGKSRPEIVGIATTGLSETQGADIHGAIREFRAAHPEFDHVALVPVNAPDTLGNLETGFALAVEAIIETLVPVGRRAGKRRRQVNVLAPAMLTAGDIEQIKEWIEAFGLRPVVLPDLGDSLDGHLVEAEYSPLTLGGTPRVEIAAMGESVATLVIGPSLDRAADLLRQRTGVPDYRFAGLMGLEACDAFTQTLADISGKPVPPRIERRRAQLQDAMVDSHFMLGFARVAVAADPDLLGMLAGFLAGVGAEVVAGATTARTTALEPLPARSIVVGDLEDLEALAAPFRPQLVIANAHAVAAAERLGAPLLRAGFPQYDRLGGHARAWVGYPGSRQALFDIANLILGEHHDIEPYRSLYWRGTDRDREHRPGALPATGLVP